MSTTLGDVLEETRERFYLCLRRREVWFESSLVLLSLLSLSHVTTSVRSRKRKEQDVSLK